MKNQEFHDRIYTAMKIKCEAENLTCGSYYADLLFPNNPRGNKEVSKLFTDNSKNLTVNQIAIILDDLGDIYINLLSKNKEVSIPTESEFIVQLLSGVGAIGAMCNQIKQIFNGDDILNRDEGRQSKNLLFKAKVIIDDLYYKSVKAEKEG